tara:strand:+ start:1903 stop:2037 length:135 start_codon:yes stop_codon:yes gene_type:complete
MSLSYVNGITKYLANKADLKANIIRTNTKILASFHPIPLPLITE